MLEANGNIFNISCDALCITTNGYVKTNGNAVMGRGCALQAAKKIPDLPRLLGQSIRRHGNVVSMLAIDNDSIWLSFPVKPKSVICDGSNVVHHMSGKFKTGHKVPGCFAKAEIEIIGHSAKELVQLTNEQGWSRVLLPRPGCGAGELDWDIDVKPVLDGIFDDRFVCVTY